MRITLIIAVLNLMIGRNEPKNLQILHVKNITLDSFGLNAFTIKQDTNNKCLRWHKTVKEELKNIEYGTDAKIGEFPYTVLILFINEGNIINEYWIITAAHCVSDYSTDQLRIYPGISDYTNNTVSFDKADRIFIHESYNNKTNYLPIWYDIALIKLTEKIAIKIWSTANSVCLPAPAFVIDTPELAMFTGWGFINESHRNDGRLQNTQIKLNQIFQNLLIFSKEIIKGKICSSDSGGPLVQYINGRAVLIGVVKGTLGGKGKHCGPITDIVFCSVPNHIKWIIEKIQNN